MSEAIQITDIHTHVLPGIDDGPGTPQDALRLLAAHRAAGTDRIFCTSHLGSPHFQTSNADLSGAFSVLTNKLAAEPKHEDTAATVEITEGGVDATPQSTQTYPEFVPGAEVRVTPQLTDVLVRGDIVTLGDTHYVLLEYPNNELNSRMLDVVHELSVRGYHPIMAHPERNIVIQKDASWIQTLVDAGLLLQLTAACLEQPPNGRSHMADKLAWSILERGLAAVVASDAHDTAYRPPGLLSAYESIADRLGSDVTDALIQNANSIWNDEPIQAIPVSKRKRGLFRRQ